MAGKTKNTATDFLTQELDKAQGEIDAQKKARQDAIDKAEKVYADNMATVLDDFEKYFKALDVLDPEATSKYDSPDVLRGKEDTKAKGTRSGGTRGSFTYPTDEVVKYVKDQGEPVRPSEIATFALTKIKGEPSTAYFSTHLKRMREEGLIKLADGTSGSGSRYVAA